MKIQIKRDEVSKDTKNHLKFKNKLRKILMQREENKAIDYVIDSTLASFEDFDPLLDWQFRPVCGCETAGMEEDYYNVKHNKLFKKSGHLLWDELISGYTNGVSLTESFELWMLEDMSLVFTYCCAFGIPECEEKMYYRYPLGKKIPANMDLDAESFLDEMREKIHYTRHPM